MRASRDRSQRRAAATFLVAALPLAVAVALAGGALALAPLALLLIPVLLTGRAPGIERLQGLRARSGPACLAPAASVSLRAVARRITAGGLLIAASLSKRGPPVAC